tara:strand:- start:10328 stop:10804 length:477 start_codon:yes stop_codon:yes gene_type:complete
MKNHFLLFLLTAFIFGTSCRNDDDGDNDALSGYEKIVDKNWRLTGAEVRANGIILANRSLVFDCERDNVTRYESSGTATTRYGVLKCDPTEPNEEFYFWTLISNDAKLILDYGGPNVQVYNNIVNDGRNLVLERFTIEDVDNDGTQESVQTRLTYARS